MAAPLDSDRLREALAMVDREELQEAMELLAPIVRAKRFTRASRVLAEPLEVSEVRDWLRAAIEDPGSDDARFYVDRAYYKLRTLRSADAD
jgi:hypothetical protein